jgi:hypothetical protein
VHDERSGRQSSVTDDLKENTNTNIWENTRFTISELDEKHFFVCGVGEGVALISGVTKRQKTLHKTGRKS